MDHGERSSVICDFSGDILVWSNFDENLEERCIFVLWSDVWKMISIGLMGGAQYLKVTFSNFPVATTAWVPFRQNLESEADTKYGKG